MAACKNILYMQQGFCHSHASAPSETASGPSPSPSHVVPLCQLPESAVEPLEPWSISQGKTLAQRLHASISQSGSCTILTASCFVFSSRPSRLASCPVLPSLCPSVRMTWSS